MCIVTYPTHKFHVGTDIDRRDFDRGVFDIGVQIMAAVQREPRLNACDNHHEVYDDCKKRATDGERGR